MTSTMATCLPSPATANAASIPPGPAPMTVTFFVEAIEKSVKNSKNGFKDSPLSSQETKTMLGFVFAGATYLYQRWFKNHPDIPIESLAGISGFS